MKNEILIAILCVATLPLICCSGCIIFGMVLPEKELTPEEIAQKKLDSERSQAFRTAKKHILGSLRSPSTADFGDQYYRECVKTNDDKTKFYVSVYVDAQNGFGAMIRTKFWVTVVKKNGFMKVNACYSP